MKSIPTVILCGKALKRVVILRFDSVGLDLEVITYFARLIFQDIKFIEKMY